MPLPSSRFLIVGIDMVMKISRSCNISLALALSFLRMLWLILRSARELFKHAMVFPRQSLPYIHMVDL